MEMFLIDSSKDYFNDKFSPSRLVKLEEFYDTGYCFPDYINSGFLHKVRQLEPVGTYIIIDEKRPDLISWDIYNRVDLWWVILIYNGLTIEGLLPGVIVKYPSLTDLEVIIHNLTAQAKG